MKGTTVNLLRKGFIILAAALMAAPAIADNIPKNIILMIGDGMGPGQREAAQAYRCSKAGLPADAKAGQLTMNRLPVQGLAITAPYDPAKTTDSAASGTALSCGEKTKNGRIAMDEPGKKSFRSFTYDAKERGQRVGILTSVPIDHATPAAYYAVSPARGDYLRIARQLPTSGFDFFGGETFKGKNSEHVGNIEKAGYILAQSHKEMAAINPGQKAVVLHDFPNVVDKDPNALTLGQLTAKALQLLENDKGFFMMVEGGKIDWTGHANDLPANIMETLEFDDAVAVALAFQQAHPTDTLLIVTADHETGGLKKIDPANTDVSDMAAVIEAQGKSAGAYREGLVKLFNAEASFDELTAYAAGSFGLNDLTEAELAKLKTAYAAVLASKVEQQEFDYNKNNKLLRAMQHVLAERSGFQWTTGGHTPVDVPTSAIGPGAQAFSGRYQNTQIARTIRAFILAQ